MVKIVEIENNEIKKVMNQYLNDWIQNDDLKYQWMKGMESVKLEIWRVKVSVQ